PGESLATIANPATASDCGLEPQTSENAILNSYTSFVPSNCPLAVLPAHEPPQSTQVDPSPILLVNAPPLATRNKRSFASGNGLPLLSWSKSNSPVSAESLVWSAVTSTQTWRLPESDRRPAKNLIFELLA